MDKNDISRKEALKRLGGLTLGSAFVPPLLRGRNDNEQIKHGYKSSGGSKSGQPHIIFLMADQFRADALGCAGNPAVKTPNIDALYRDGVLFNNAYSSVPSCTPARACLLTGMNPWHNGMLGYGRMARKYKYELPRMIRSADYYTYGIGKNHWFPQKSLHGFNGTLVDESGRINTDGFVSDYHDWFKHKAPGKDPNATGLGWNSYHTKTYALPEELHPTHWIGQSAVDFIHNYDLQKPLFLKVSWERPHTPLDPPQRFVDMYKGVSIPAPVVGGKGTWDERFAHDHPNRPNAWLGNFGKAQAIKSKRYYYANITFVDEQIGRIIDILKKKGIYDNAIITFCADHGAMLGDHYHWRKTYPYEGSVAIPYIYKWPSGFGAKVKRGSKLSEPVGLQDFLPTFLEATGQHIPKDMDGMSLLQLLRGNTDGWRKYIGMEHATTYWKKNYWAAATNGKFKYIWYFSDYPAQFFDLKKDPGEIRNVLNQAHLSKETKQEIQRWRGYLIDYLKERGPGFVKNNQLVKRQKNMLYSPNYPHWKEDDPKWLKYWIKQYRKSYNGEMYLYEYMY
jgi:arylsulfatase A-like enzyme